MEKSQLVQFVKFYETFDIMVTAKDKTLTVDFRVFKGRSQPNTRNYEMRGLIKAFELIPAKSEKDGFCWISVILDMTEPTYYLWNFEIEPNSDVLKEISKIELGYYNFEALCCPAGGLSLKLYAVSREVLLEVKLPEHGNNKYNLQEISSIPNPHCVFDAFGSLIITPSEKGFDLLDTATENRQTIWGNTPDTKETAAKIKFSRDGRKIAVAIVGVFCSYKGKTSEN